MKDYKYAIVVVGYNRADSINRLLKSLDKVDYYGCNVNLIISIDNSGTHFVEDVADNFEWKYGEKIIRTYEKRLGLRRHILNCGDFLDDYDAIAVLEDDLIVSPTMFGFMKASVEKYYDNERIAGISLYSHLWNPNAGKPFEPIASEYDCYFIQMAQSWGQIWMKKQWKNFIKWYEMNNGEFPESLDFPNYITHWTKSWLKYHIKYCVVNNKYFLYPYCSYTTCFNEAGEHSIINASIFQVPLLSRKIGEFRFPDLDEEDAIVYDVFFERIGLGKYLNIDDNNLIVDLYATKNEKLAAGKYLLSSKQLNYRIINRFGLQMRPHESNIEYMIQGNHFYLYDMSKSNKNANEKYNLIKSYIYYHKIHGDTKCLIKTCGFKIKENISIKFQQIKKRLVR